MKFHWFGRKKKSIQEVETKSGVTLPPYVSLAGAMESAGFYDIAFSAIIEYYKKCAPLADAVDTIADGVSGIIPKLWDKQKKEYVENHPIYELLMFPNSDQSFEDFMRELSSFDALCQNAFIEMVGEEPKPPNSIEIRSPAYITLQPDSIGEIGSIRVNTSWIQDVYEPEFIERRKRYRNKNGKEIWPVLGFNANKGSSRLFGTPKIQGLYYEIEQYISSGQHNKKMLENGARPSGVFTSKTETPLTDDQWMRMQNEVVKYYSGSHNAGRPLLLENFEYKNMIMSNRDMDWDKLRTDVKETIYLRYNIPLPSVSSSSMTYSNYSTSQVAVYENSIIPQASALLSQIWMATGYRYNPKDWMRYTLTFDETEIDALEMVRTEAIKIRNEVKVNTVNELRSRLGDEPVENGDVILRPAGDVPALEDYTDADE